MTDEFNLVPTNNLEKHLDNILRAASGEEPQYDLTPNWRTEQYLAAITAKLSGGGSGGGVLVVHDENGTLDKTWQEIYDALPIAVLDIPSTSMRKLFDMANTDLHGLSVSGGEYYAANSASGYPEKTTAPK